MPQYWSKEAPCAYCPATSNTSHDDTCQNANMYDERGRLIPYIKAESIQLPLDFDVTPHIRKRRTQV